MLGSGRLPVLIAGRPSDPLVLALAAGLISLILLPFIPVLPGLGSLVAGILTLLAYPRAGRRRWLVFVIVPIAGLGILLALLQLTGAFSAALGFNPW